MSAHPTTDQHEMKFTLISVLVIVCIANAYEEDYPQTLLMEAYEDWPTRYLRRDYPRNYVDCQHPDDYKAISSPLPPEFIFHGSLRLILRISFEVGAEYIPMSFMLDTAAPSEFYFSKKAADVLDKVLIESRNPSSLDISIKFGGCDREPELFPVYFTPRSKGSGNFIGMNGLMRLGLKLNEPPDSFRLGCNVSWF
jgi:hypothetical protein